MQRHRRANPLFSSLGCGTTLLLLVGLGLVLYWQGGRPFSPGELTAVQTQNTMAGGVANHATIEDDCSQCHAAWLGVSSERCEACHTNVTQQRTTDTGIHGRFQNTADCQTCHTDHQGREANITQISLSQFDHEKSTRFSLAKHQRTYDKSDMACGDCHQSQSFSVDAVDCATCHTQADSVFMAEHNDLFGTDCLACHDGIDTMAAFDHAQVFVIDGAHTAVACTDCHANHQFSNTPDNCAACHNEPTVHFGQFGTDCARCHTTTAWAPAQLTQHTFPLDHGRSTPSDCTTCHVDTYATYTCYGCHDHTENNIRSEHLEEGISDFKDCIECHPTGREEEGEHGERREDD